MDDVEYALTRGMDEAAVARRLETADAGVLALADGDDAYAVPLAHYYDGDRLYFRLAVDDDSTKQAFLETTGTATYVVHGTEPTADAREIDSWSVVVTGPLEVVADPAAAGLDAATINREFAPVRIFDEAVEDVEVVVVAMDVASATGRETLA